MTEYILLRFYKSEFTRLGIAAKRGGTPIEHAAWMAAEMFTYAIQVPHSMRDNAKVNRWIGFIQGVLWMENMYTIDHLRAHVVAAKEGTDAPL